jgi:hypothetical protein
MPRVEHGGAMPQLILLACLAALFPLMLAAVVVMLTRPKPKRLLVSFLIGGWAMSITAGLLVLSAFSGTSDELLGSNDTVHPGAYLVFGALCLVAAYVMGTARGAEMRARRAARRPAKPAAEGPSRAERALGGDRPAVAFVVGAVINLPGIYYLSALHDLATGDYTTAQQLSAIVVFNLIMFSFAEIPLLGYLISPEKTADLVGRFQAFLGRNATRIVAILALGFGAALIVKGILVLT